MEPLLFEAVTSGNLDLLKSCIDKNLDLRQVTAMKDTTIHIAVGLGHLEIIKSIHSRFPTLFTNTNLMGDTPLHRAVRGGHLEVVSLLVIFSKDIEIGRAHEFLRRENREKCTVMHEAVRCCQRELVKLLIKEDPEILCIVNDSGESPLYLAVEKGNLKMVEQILQSNQYSYSAPNGRTALHAAISNKRPDIALLLLEKKPEIIKEVDDNKRTPLHFASVLGISDSVQVLLNFDTSIACFQDKYGYTPVHMSSCFGRLNILSEFLRVQPDLKYLLDGRWRNILHIAIECQQVHVVKYISKEKGFDDLLNGKDVVKL